MKKKTKLLMIAGLVLATSQVCQPTVSANDSGTAIGVTPLPSKSQKGSFNGYFNLIMKPKQVEELEFTVSNSSKKKVTVDVVTENTRTNQQMQVDYGSSKLKSSHNVPIDLKDVIKGPRTLVMKPNETKRVKYQLTMPKEFGDGILAGGFTFMARQDDAEKSSSKSDKPKVQNKYSYVIGLVMAQKDKPVKPGLDINNVQLAQWNNRNALGITLTADKATFIKGLDTHVSVVNKATDKEVLESSEKGHNIAPYSVFDWKVPLGDEKRWEPGTYVVTVDLKNKEDNWHFEKELVITDGEAKKYNDDDVTIKDNSLIWWLAGLLVLIIVAILGALKIVQNRKKKQINNSDVFKK